jgi:hypothetical protein
MEKATDSVLTHLHPRPQLPPHAETRCLHAPLHQLLFIGWLISGLIWLVDWLVGCWSGQS